MTPENISFREHPDAGDEIPVYFEEKTILFNKAAMPSRNAGDNQFSVRMVIGVIDKLYQSKQYFNWPNQGVLGLAPTELSAGDERL